MSQSSILIFELLIVYHVKHFLCDFLFQNSYMLKKSKPGFDFVLPLASHCLVHGGFTLLICLYYAPKLWWLSLVDFSVHFMIDRIKSGPNYLGRFNDMTKNSFWNILGLDQTAHHLTHLGIVFLIVKSL